jgi:murein DD-endopeptidase MepM/ murein hydrolase activator NlpD
VAQKVPYRIELRPQRACSPWAALYLQSAFRRGTSPRVEDAPEPMIPAADRKGSSADDMDEASNPRAPIIHDPLEPAIRTKHPRLVVPPGRREMNRREIAGPPAAPRGPLSGLASGPNAGGQNALGSGLGASVRTMPRVHAGVVLSPRMTAIFGGLFGLATMTSIIALLIQVVPPRDERAVVANAGLTHRLGDSPDQPEGSPAPEPKKRERVAVPGPWRLSELSKDPSVQIASGTIGSKSFIDALAEKNVPKAQAYRIMKAFAEVRKFDKCGKKDRYYVALDRATKRVKAFEYEVNATDIIQAAEDQTGILVGKKLDMQVAEAEVTGAFYVSKDVSASYKFGGFEDGVVSLIDDALGGRLSSEGFDEGSTIRLIAVEETALGSFSKYKRVVALEYRPADPAGKPIRIYAFHGQESRGYWDEKGKQPYAGGWQSPVPGAPVTSRFNPKRMHPVLKKYMPHNGTDLGAPTGTPVYSAFRGVVDWVGPAGPSGNLVTVTHPNGVQTGYAHLSKFAPGIKIGMKVGAHQLVGFVGSTGRSTGPHLHFSAKKNGQFFDAETLQFNGERVMPAMDRAAFIEVKAELDKRLDAIPLPEPPREPARKVAAPATSSSASASAGTGASSAAANAPGAPPQPAAAPVEEYAPDDDESGIPIPAPLLGALPLGPSTATPMSNGSPSPKPSVPAASAGPEPEVPDDDPDEESQAH